MLSNFYWFSIFSLSKSEGIRSDLYADLWEWYFGYFQILEDQCSVSFVVFRCFLVVIELLLQHILVSRNFPVLISQINLMLWWRLRNSSNISGRLVLRLAKMLSTKHWYNFDFLCGEMTSFLSFFIKMSGKTASSGLLTVQPSASL